MQKSLLKPFINVSILMVITWIALVYGLGVELRFTPGVKMQLPDKTTSFSGNQLRFCHNADACAAQYRDASFSMDELEFPDICPNCGEQLFNCARAEKEQLPDDTEFVKAAYYDHDENRLLASIVLSGSARDSIHRPQRCLKGQGNTLEHEYTLEVPIAGREPLPVRIIRTSRIFKTAEGEVPYYGFYAYWFVGQKHETPYHLERMFWIAWDRVVNSEADRWAYIAVSGTREKEGVAYEEQIIQFVQEVYPTILTDALYDRVYAKKK